MNDIPWWFWFAWPALTLLCWFVYWRIETISERRFNRKRMNDQGDTDE